MERCTTVARNGGMCLFHYENKRLRGDPLKTGRGRLWRVGESKWAGVTCALEGCERPVRTAGWCVVHYERVRRLGEPGPVDLLQAPKGAGTTNKLGYREINIDGRRVLEHRYIMEQVLGRELRSDEHVHHINGVRDDNRPENLEIWVQSHPPGQRVPDLLAWAYEIIARYEKE